MTESSLLYMDGEGKQRFVHDTIRDYFLASALVTRIRESSNANKEIASIYESIISKSPEDYNLHFSDVSDIGRELRVACRFLDESIGHAFPNHTMDSICSDEFLDGKVEVASKYSAGPDSKVLIHFNPLTLTSMEVNKNALEVYTYLANEYGVKLFIDPEPVPDIMDATQKLWGEYDINTRYKIGLYLMHIGRVAPIEFFILVQDATYEKSPPYRFVGLGDYEARMKLFEMEGKKIGNADSFNTGEYLKINYQFAQSIAAGSAKFLSNSKEDTALLEYFHIGPIGHINPYILLANGVSYINLVSPGNPEMDREKYRKMHQGQFDSSMKTDSLVDAEECVQFLKKEGFVSIEDDTKP